MTSKVLYFSLIVAVAAISAGTLALTAAETEAKPMLVNTIQNSMEDVALDVLTNTADYAIVGQVISVEPVVYIDPERAVDKAANKDPNVTIFDKEILSDVTIRVEQDLFDKYEEKIITVRVPGGEIEGYKTIHESSPEFVDGERVIVFVGNGQSYSISEDNYTIIGYYQGTIRLGDTVDSKFATQDTTENDMKNQIKSLKNRD
jgi:hypothetical protein